MAPDTIERAALALKDPSLLRMQCYIDGKWAGADDGATRQRFVARIGFRVKL